MQPVSVSQLVNQVGRYLYNHIDGAYKTVKRPNTYDIYMTVYYQLPRLQQVPGREKEGYNDMHEMKLNISLTTYQNKIRVNIHEITPEEYTFSYMLIPPEQLQDITKAQKLIYDKVVQRIENHYKDWLFLF